MPGWLAVTEQVPVPSMEITEPDTVHTAGVVEAKLTGSPEVAVAMRLNGAERYVTPVIGANVIVWPPGVTVKVCVTLLAGA